MKKNLLAMTAMLSLCVAFGSCSKTSDLYDEGAVEKAQQDKTIAQYKENFVKHFGEIPSNQSWDFTSSSAQGARTRAVGRNIPEWTEPNFFEHFIPNHYSHVATDFEEVTRLAESDDIKPIDWDFKYGQFNLHPFYSHGSDVANCYYVGIEYINKRGNKVHEAVSASSLGEGWGTLISLSKLLTIWNMNSYAYVNTSKMEGDADFKWYVKGCEAGFFDKEVYKAELTKCKLFNVNGHTYAAFDCTGNQQYTDLVCWVEDMAPAKRYMVEDLGSVSASDFDFNDIVFDVRRKANSPKNNPQYECVVRAMGGTIDFTITIGGSSWTKSSKYPIGSMINTEGEYELSAEYAVFDVNGWEPAKNNVTVTVDGKNGKMVLPFPEDGDVPFMVATSIGKTWSKERVNVNTLGWFGDVENNSTAPNKD